MIPLRDSEPIRGRPVVVWIIIALNVAAFTYELGLGGDFDAFVRRHALVPARYFALAGLGPAFWPARFGPIFTSMFLHGGWLHIIFNMWFLWIFGRNIGGELGPARFTIFYLVCGVAAAYLELYTDRYSGVPMLGASGAIAGVLGAFVVLHPRARILTLVPIFIFIQIFELPAIIFIGFWFVLQFFAGTLSLAARSGQAGGTAYWAHVGGFAAGAVLVNLFRKRAAGDTTQATGGK